MGKLLALLLLALCLPAYAGTWGPGVFDSDQALDTSSGWAENGTVEDVRKALHAANTDGYLEAPAAEDALVAAEVVAAASGRPNKDLPEDLAAWILRQPGSELRALSSDALSAVARVRQPGESELHELWAEGGADDWLTGLDDLVSRLEAGAAGQAH